MHYQFKFPMRRYEQITGLIYIPIHALLIPWALELLYITFMFPAGIPFDAALLNLIYYTFSFVFVLASMFRFLRDSFSDFFDGFLNSLSSIALGYVGYFIMAVVFSVATSFLTQGTTNPNNENVGYAVQLNANVMFVVSVLFAPIVEEALFRGALFGTLRKKSRLLAYIVTILVFGFYHIWQYMVADFQWIYLLYVLQYAAPTIALCWSYERSGSIWTPILIHAIINCISVTAQIRA